MQGTVRFSMMQSGLTSQNSASLLLALSSRGISCLVTMMSGEMPIALSSLTECWVGLVFCSPDEAMYGTSVTWI